MHKEIVRYGELVRDWLRKEAVYSDVKEYDKADFTGFCCPASLLLSQLLKDNGIESRVVIAYSHVYVEALLGGCWYVVDATASQFKSSICHYSSVLVSKRDELLADLDVEFESGHWSAVSHIVPAEGAVDAIIGGKMWSTTQCFSSVSSFNKAYKRLSAYATIRVKEVVDSNTDVGDESFASMLAYF